MEIKSLDNLKKDTNGVFDYITTIISNNNNIQLYSFPLTDRHNGRIDLVALDIYNNIKNIDILVTLNSIINTHTIEEGNIIFYIEDVDVDVVRKNDNIKNDIKEAISKANKGKEQRIDSNRQKDKTNQKNIEKAKILLPPQISKGDNIIVENGKIILKPNF